MSQRVFLVAHLAFAATVEHLHPAPALRRRYNVPGLMHERQSDQARLGQKGQAFLRGGP